MEPLASRIQDLTADILTGIVDGVIVIEAGGQVIIWNRAAEEMTGIAAADALGKNIAIVLADNPGAAGLVEKTFSSGRSYSDYDAELSVKHRPPCPVGLVTSVLTDDDGIPTGVILTIRDQAGVRELKERMRRSDRLATLGMIAAGIAHEVKNPLVGISGAAQLMKSEVLSGNETGKGAGQGRNLIEYLDVILKEADRLLDDLAIDLIAEIGDPRKAHVLDQRAAEVFGHSFEQKQKQQRDGKHRPDVVDAPRDERVQIDDVMSVRNREQCQGLDCRLGIQNHVERGLDRERHQPINRSHHGD